MSDHPLELLGVLGHRDYSEATPNPALGFDTDFIRRGAQAFEDLGFDRVLVANWATSPDSMPVATYAASVTRTLKFMIAHRPGFVAPTMTARMLATIDQISDGRAGVHIITGGNDIELQADGDFLDKARRYERSGEYVEVMKRMWSSEAPFDHQGDFYRFNQAFASVKPVQRQGLPVFWAGTSPIALEIGARVADVYAIGADSPQNAAQSVSTIRGFARTHGRDPAYLLSIKVIVGLDEEDAWRKADVVLRRSANKALVQGLIRPGDGETAEAAMERAISHSLATYRGERFWNGVKSFQPFTLPSLVGDPDQVAAVLLDYYDAGVSRFILHGFDPQIAEAGLFAEQLLPRVRAAVAERRAAAETRCASSAGQAESKDRE